MKRARVHSGRGDAKVLVFIIAFAAVAIGVCLLLFAKRSAAQPGGSGESILVSQPGKPLVVIPVNPAPTPAPVATTVATPVAPALTPRARDRQTSNTFEFIGRAIDAESKVPIAGILFSTVSFDRSWTTQTPITEGAFAGRTRIIYHDAAELPAGGPASPATPEPGEQCLSAADGTFTLKFKGAHQTALVIYYQSGAGYVAVSSGPMQTLSVRIPPGSATPFKKDFEFRHAGKLLVRVFQSDGTTPAPDATVAFRMNQYGRSGSAVKEGNGVSSIDVLPKEVASLRAVGDAGEGETAVTIPPAGEPIPAAKIVLQKYAEISGHVKDGSGKPLAGIPVNAYSTHGMAGYGPMHENSELPKTDGEGYYFIDKLGPGEWSVGAGFHTDLAIGKRREVTSPLDHFADAPQRSISLKEGEYRKDVDFVLQEQAPLAGIVLSATDSAPIAGATVSARSPSTNQTLSADTDGDGRFVINGLDADAEVPSLIVRAEDYENETLDTVSPLGGPITIRMRRASSMRLAVKREGVAVPDFDYRAIRNGGRQDVTRNGVGLETFDTRKPAGVVHDSSDGTTVIHDIIEGNWEVKVRELSPDGNPTGRVGVGQFGTNEPFPSTTVTVEIGEARKVTGVVVGRDSRPVSGATVELDMADPASGDSAIAATGFGPRSVKADESGRFALLNVFPGKHFIDAIAEENRHSRQPLLVEVETDKDPDPVTIVVLGNGAFFGKVTNRNGDPAAGVRVICKLAQFAGAPARETSTDAGGNYRIDDLAAGFYDLSANDGADGLEDSRPFSELKAGEEPKIDFDFTGKVKLHGSVTINGAAWPQGFFLALWSDKHTHRNLQNTGEGRYSLLIDPGVYRLSLGRNGYSGPSPVTVTVEKGSAVQTHDFNLDFVDITVVLVFPTDADFSAGEVSMSAVDPSGLAAPLKLASAIASKPSVSLPLALAGDYQFAFKSTDGQWMGATVNFTVAAGRENVVTIDVTHSAAAAAPLINP